MRVLIVNTNERTGGAAVAAGRLVEALINNGVKAKMLVLHKQTDSINVASCVGNVKAEWDFLRERFGIWIANRFSRRYLFAVSTASTGTDITEMQEFREADVIHLHWINQGMLSLKVIRKILTSGKPVVWTMHDMWPMTGICHHSHECDNYKRECGNCHFLAVPSATDLSNKVFLKKKDVYSYRKINFVAVSNWLAGRAADSLLLHGHNLSVIPNSISVERFKCYERDAARVELSIEAKYVIAFGAARIDWEIKGLKYLLAALKLLVDRGTFARGDLHILLFGGYKEKTAFDDIPVPYTYMGFVDDEDKLSDIYSASDVAVSSSLYETFGQTLIEAQACGCLPVSFGNSGQTDIITHKENGYLADYLSADSLADGIEWGLKENVDRRLLRNNVLKKYSERIVASKYIDLYNKIATTKA